MIPRRASVPSRRSRISKLNFDDIGEPDIFVGRSRTDLLAQEVDREVGDWSEDDLADDFGNVGEGEEADEIGSWEGADESDGDENHGIDEVADK